MKMDIGEIMVYAFMGFLALLAVFVVGPDLLKTLKGAEHQKEMWRTYNTTSLSVATATLVEKRKSTGRLTGTKGKVTEFTKYHATFEFENGERKEFVINSSDYDSIKYGDVGQLAFQGVWYKGFE